MKEFDKLKDIIDTLRSPQGCPWDNKQTHDSLLTFLLEETNEVVDTIINNQSKLLMDELGDLLLQVMLHAKIEEENNNFTIKDVIDNLNKKLIRRHPHVFGKEKALSSETVIKLWENIKKEEKKQFNNKSIFDDIPKNFEPLLKSYKIQKAASKVGFDWKNHLEVMEKVDEELNELKAAIKVGSNIEHELGDLLFAIVNLSRFLNLKSEVSLIKANNRFIKRFNYIETRISDLKKKFEDFTLDELENFWNEAKKNIT